MNAEQRQTSIAQGTVTVVVTLLSWASVPLFLRHFSNHIDKWTSNGWRYGFSALVWLPVLIVTARGGRLPRGLWRAALVPSLFNAIGQVCFTSAHYYIDPALLTFGLRSQLLFVAIGAWLMFPRERGIIRSPGYLVGTGLLVAGMIAVMLLAPPTGADSAGHATTAAAATAARDTAAAHTRGIILAVASGLLFACYGLAVRKCMEGINSVIAFAAICQYTAIVMVGLMLVLGQRWGLTVIDQPLLEIGKLFASALLGIAFGHMFYYMSLARLGVAITAGVLQLQPFIVAVGSLWLFDERLGPWQWAGGCTAVVGAMLMLGVQWIKSRAAKSLEEPVAIAEGESGA